MDAPLSINSMPCMSTCSNMHPCSHALHGTCRYDKADEAAEFIIDETFGVPGVGTVVAGMVKKGVISTSSSTLLLGPHIGDATFKPAAIKSIHYKRLPVTKVRDHMHHHLRICSQSALWDVALSVAPLRSNQQSSDASEASPGSQHPEDNITVLGLLVPDHVCDRLTCLSSTASAPIRASTAPAGFCGAGLHASSSCVEILTSARRWWRARRQPWP